MVRISLPTSLHASPPHQSLPHGPQRVKPVQIASSFRQTTTPTTPHARGNKLQLGYQDLHHV